MSFRAQIKLVKEWVSAHLVYCVFWLSAMVAWGVFIHMEVSRLLPEEQMRHVIKILE